MSPVKPSPPRAARRILFYLKQYEKEYSLSTELEDEFCTVLELKGRLRASIWYWAHVISAIPVYARQSLQTMGSMLLNYFKISLRQIRRHKIYSVVNIAGLALGMACCLTVLLFVQEEMQYDRFHTSADRVFRIYQELHRPAGDYPSIRVHSWLGPGLAESFPEVEDAARVVRWAGIVSHSDKRFDERLFYADASFLDIFTFPLLRGDIKSALFEPHKVVISQKMAEKYFGNQEPLGKVLTVDGQYDFTVSGVLAAIPRNSHIKFDFLASYEHVRHIFGEERYSQGRINVYTYLLLKNRESFASVEEKIPLFLREQKGERYANLYTLSLQPLTAIHLQSHTSIELEKSSRASYSYLLTAIALLILLVACINSINLSTARASRRSLEVGVRKVVGANRRRLFQQFVGESLVFAMIAAVLGLVFTQSFLPVFNSIMDRSLTLDFFSNPAWWLGLLGITLGVGFVSGFYPALFLASFRPGDILKSKGGRIRLKGLVLRKALVVFQFALAAVFIIGTLIVARQIDFIQNKNLGFEKENVLILPPPLKLESGYSGFKSELLQNPDILEITASTGMPGRYSGIPFNFNLVGEDKSDPVPLDYMAVDHDYFKFYGMQIISGRSVSEDYPGDEGNSLILNQAAVKKLGLGNPLGMQLAEERDEVSGTVVGIVKDFHNVSLHEQIRPAVYQIHTQMLGQVAVRTAPGKIQEVLQFLESKWSLWAPHNIFYYSFLDQDLDALYEGDQKAGLVFRIASVLSILIACLGLLGLSVYSTEQRIKEIGIRKTLGASVPGIVTLLTREYLMLILISNLAAWPIVYFVMSRWFQNFVYHAPLALWLFFVGGGLSLLVSLIPVGIQALKAAAADPVESLRYE